MKFGRAGQITLVTATALGVATLFTACGTLTVGFLYVATNKQTPGQIEVYEVNSESGSLRTIPTSPFPSGGRDPIAEVPSSDSENLYVTNQDDNNIVQFGIGTDGKLYPQSTINTPGSYPLALAMNNSLGVLYVLDTLEPIAGCTLDNLCPGDVAGYVVTPSKAWSNPGSLGQTPAGCAALAKPSSPPTCTIGTAITNGNGLPLVPIQLTPSNTTTILTPTAINVLANGNYAYVTAYNAATNHGYLFAYSINQTAPADSTSPSLGALTPLNGGLPYSVGSEPVSLISDSGSSVLYVVDKLTNSIYTYSVASGTPSLISTASTGNQPIGVSLFTDAYLYVTNSADSNVTAFRSSGGVLTPIGTYASDVNPIAVTVDPRKVGFLYTVNYLGSTLSGYQINPSTGALINTKNSPYASTVQPTAIAGIPHGGTATSSTAK